MMDSVLTGEKTYLRSLEREDLSRTWEWMHRPDVYERIGVLVPFSHSQQEVWFENLQKAKDKVVFAICRKEDNEHIGNVSLDAIDHRYRNARISIFLAVPEARGKGYGSDALRILIRYAFDFLNLHRVWCKTDADDESLVRFYQRLGFAREGTLRDHEFKCGRYVDKALWGILRTRPSIS